MKRYKYILIVSLALLISIICFYLFIPKNIIYNDIPYKDEVSEVRLEYEDPKDKASVTPVVKDIKSDDVNSRVVYLKVLDKNYKVNVKDGASVLDVMKNAQKDGFSFKGKDYEEMGYFVEEINGISNSPKGYWLYYVNEKQAEVGVSRYIIKEGDIINWRLE